MGMAAGSSGSGARRRGPRRRHLPMAEINVTPMVDVMLVLLIVFMVAAPLLTVGIPVDLPRANAQPLSSDTQPLNVTVRAGGKIFLQEAEVSSDDLATKITGILATDPDKRVIVSGDRDADYGTVASVFAMLKEAGTSHVLLQTRPVGDTDG